MFSFWAYSLELLFLHNPLQNNKNTGRAKRKHSKYLNITSIVQTCSPCSPPTGSEVHYSSRCASVYSSRCMKQKQESFMLQSKAEHLFLENIYGIFGNKRPGRKEQYLGRELPVLRTLKRRRRSGSGSTCVKGSKIKRSGTRRRTGIAEVRRREVRWPAPRKQAALRQRATLLYATGTVREPLVFSHKLDSEETQENGLSCQNVLERKYWWICLEITHVTSTNEF